MFLRKGRALTHGVENEVDEDPDLEADGFAKARTWYYDPRNPDYSALKAELVAAVSRLLEQRSGNAVAITTDSSFMTVGFAVHSFSDFATADDEVLWTVDEWDSWIDDDEMDAAYRWLLAYGYNCDDPDLSYEVFRENVLRILQEVLMTFSDEWKVRLINVAGDDCGHRWSVPCMDKEFSDRMMSWI